MEDTALFLYNFFRYYIWIAAAIGVICGIVNMAVTADLKAGSGNQTDESFFDVDLMSGGEFEKYTVRLLKSNGYTNVEKTKTSGDYGIDVTARKDGKKYAFQCKCYQGKVGVHAVQEAFSGAKMYRADVAAVITNSTFTPNARKMAKEIGVLLIDRDRLEKLMKKAELGLSVDDLG